MSKNLKIHGVSVLTLGRTSSDNCKVYISNKSLQKTFKSGQKVAVKYNKEKKYISVVADDINWDHTISKKGNNTPVLDIKNKRVGNTLGYDVEKIEVVFFENKVIIKIAKKENLKTERSNKKGRNTFELFSGGGTLSKFFSSIKDKNGNPYFTVRGGLELDENYRAIFCENNPHEEIFSIGGRIEDIHASYYPKDVDLVLAGIPCDNFSPSNVLLNKAKREKNEGISYDSEVINKMYNAEALVFHVLTAIQAMNPRTVVIEEVEAFSKNPSSNIIRAILAQMSYKITEKIVYSMHSKRKRWVLVADMNSQINLDDLEFDDGKTIEDFLEVSLENRKWQTADQNLRVSGMIRKGLGIRSILPSDKKANVFTKNGTRHTECILKKSEHEDLYSEFTVNEIRAIHGLGEDFILDKRTGISREVLAQGVTEIFMLVGERIKEHYEAFELNEYNFDYYECVA